MGSERRNFYSDIEFLNRRELLYFEKKRLVFNYIKNSYWDRNSFLKTKGRITKEIINN